MKKLRVQEHFFRVNPTSDNISQAQLRDSMSKQAEVLIKGKRQTEGTLHSLRRQVDALGELVTSTSVDSAPSPSLSHLESSLVEDSQHGHSQVRGSLSLESPGILENFGVGDPRRLRIEMPPSAVLAKTYVTAISGESLPGL